MKPRLAYVSTHPIQYQAPLFRALARRSSVELRVYFASDHGVRLTRDPGFGQLVQWDVPLLEGYEHEFVPNLAWRPGLEHFDGLINPSMGARIAAWKPDVVVIHGYARLPQLLALAYANLRGTPVLLRGESNLLPKRSRSVRIAKSLAGPVLRRLLFGAVAIGSHNRDYYRHYGLPDDRIWFAPYAVDNDFFARDAEGARARALAWRRELGISDDELVVGYAAKLIPVKDCRSLIEAFGRARLEKAALLIVGDGSERSQLEALSRSFPQAKVRFTGFVNQAKMPEAYAAADVFVLPSVYEPWGLAINEAMSLGRPVIVSDQVSCAPDLVRADNGWVFPAGDIEALRRTLQIAREDRARLPAMGDASRRRIAGWGIEECAAGFERAVLDVCARRTP